MSGHPAIERPNAAGDDVGDDRMDKEVVDKRTERLTQAHEMKRNGPKVCIYSARLPLLTMSLNAACTATAAAQRPLQQPMLWRGESQSRK